MPKTSAATRTELASKAARTVAGTNGPRVTIDLVFQGVTYNPVDIMDALLTKYGAGKVATDRDALRGDVLQFRITP